MIELAASLGSVTRNLPVAPVYMGQQRCEPLHQYSRIRNEYLVHFVVEGTGSVHIGNTVTTLQPGQVFIIPPGQEHWYQADRDNPWTYWWIGFIGPPQETLKLWFRRAALPTVVSISPEDHRVLETAYRNMWELLRQKDNRYPPILLVQELIAFLTVLFVPAAADSKSQRDDPPPAATAVSPPGETGRWHRIDAFMEAHYSETMTVQSLCRTVGVSRAELHRLCVRYTGHSAKQELTRRRMERAAVLLREPDRHISRVAALCGYQEYQTFARQFQRYFGASPGTYRQRATRVQPRGGPAPEPSEMT